MKTSLVIVLILSAALLGCASDSNSSAHFNVSTVFKSEYCGPASSNPGLNWLAGPEQWQAYQKRLAADPRVKSEGVVSENSKGVLVVSLGQQTSGGYGIDLGPQAPFIEIDGAANRETRTLVIPMTVTEPKPGGMRITVMTQPCIGLAIVSDHEIGFVKVLSNSATAFEAIRIP